MHTLLLFEPVSCKAGRSSRRRNPQRIRFVSCLALYRYKWKPTVCVICRRVGRWWHSVCFRHTVVGIGRPRLPLFMLFLLLLLLLPPLQQATVALSTAVFILSLPRGALDSWPSKMRQHLQSTCFISRCPSVNLFVNLTPPPLPQPPCPVDSSRVSSSDTHSPTSAPEPSPTSVGEQLVHKHFVVGDDLQEGFLYCNSFDRRLEFFLLLLCSSNVFSIAPFTRDPTGTSAPVAFCEPPSPTRTCFLECGTRLDNLQETFAGSLKPVGPCRVGIYVFL